MGPTNVSKSNAAEILAANNATAFISKLPQAALYSQELQPVIDSIKPGQSYPFTPIPLPYAKPAAYDQFVANPGQLLTSLETASTGLQGFLNGLDVGAADKKIADHLAAAEAAFAKGDMLTAQKELMEAQKLQSFLSMLINLIGSMQLEAIRNSKLS
jgi:hypothetical protein